ncbi:MAG: agmatinase [Acidobacteria bacterium]|nr:agmatinase [Acidobacteriota bacterium]
MTHFLSEQENFLGLPEASSDPKAAGVVIIPVPYERTSTVGRGSALGPDAVIAASHAVEFFDAALGFEPYQAAGGIATRAPLDVAQCDGPGLSGRLRNEAAHWLGLGKFVATLGGEHTSVVGAIRAHCDAYEGLTVLHLDAHCDLRPEYLGDPWNHACAMARVLDFLPLACPAACTGPSLVQVGIRSQDREERAVARERNVPVFYAHEIHDQTYARQDWIGRVIASTRPRVYVTLDCDVMDPSIMPATGAPEPDGLTWQQMDALLSRLCRERELVGFDVSELAPIPGLRHPEFTVAKLIARILGHRFARHSPQTRDT